MRLIQAKIVLTNPRRTDLQAIEIDALADTGSVHLCIPEAIAIQLCLDIAEQRQVTLADGRTKTVPYAGPIQMQYQNRTGYTGALVLGDEPLIGAIVMEDMDLVVVPGTQQLIANPLSPNVPSSVAKAAL